MNYIFICLLFLFVFYIIYDSVTIQENSVITDIENDMESLFQKLMDEFTTIFPDRNRNSGGVQFYKHIEEKNYDFTTFLDHHRFYCPVSGSPISHDRTDAKEEIIIKDIHGNKLFGHYYRCCWPCTCDITKYARVEPHTYQGNEFYVFTIEDPCKNEKDIPQSVTSFQCNQKKTVNGVHTKSGRLIIGVFFDAQPYDETNPHMKQVSDNLRSMCQERHSQKPHELRGGMGDIFVKLTQVGGSSLKNIYGEKLQSCRTSPEPGSWDENGHCSEKGGGVHQICFHVTPETTDFSTETGQSDWSTKRNENNHCMCLGAWALYKKKGKGTGSELVCDASPEMALSKNYIENWNTWNGNELPDQIKEGVDSLVEQCYREHPSEYLKDSYDKLRENYSSSEWKSVFS